MDTIMHKRRRRRTTRRRRGNTAGLRKARCVRGCTAPKSRAKGRWKRAHKRTLKACRRRCGVKAK